MTQYPPGGQPPYGNDPDESGKGDEGWKPPSEEPGGYPPPPPPGDYGNYPPPPPPGGFGSQGGGYPPPPPGDFGPTGGSYPPPGGFGPMTGEFRVGDGLGWAWNRFADNWPVWVGFTVIIVAINVLFGMISPTDPENILSFGFVDLLSIIVSAVLGWMMIRGALFTADGRKPGFGEFTQVNNVLNLAIASLLLFVATAIGLVLVIPGLVIAFLSMFTLQFVMDRNLDAISGIKASWSLVVKNIGPLLLLALTIIGLVLLGFLTCGFGFLVIGPMITLLSVYAYRTLTGRQPIMT